MWWSTLTGPRRLRFERKCGSAASLSIAGDYPSATKKLSQLSIPSLLRLSANWFWATTGLERFACGTFRTREGSSAGLGYFRAALEAELPISVHGG